MDQYEESWFDAEEDELPQNNTIAHDSSSMTDQVAPASSTSVPPTDDVNNKPLSTQLQDVEMMDSNNSVSLKKSTDSNGPSSPTFASTARVRPNSPVDNFISTASSNSESKTDSVFSTGGNAASKVFSINNGKPLVNNRTLVNSRLVSNKVQIKINSTSSTLMNQREESPSLYTNGGLLTAVNNGGSNDTTTKSEETPQPKSNLVSTLFHFFTFFLLFSLILLSIPYQLRCYVVMLKNLKLDLTDSNRFLVHFKFSV